MAEQAAARPLIIIDLPLIHGFSSSLRRIYMGLPGWAARLNQRNWIQRLNDTVYTVPQ